MKDISSRICFNLTEKDRDREVYNTLNTIPAEHSMSVSAFIKEAVIHYADSLQTHPASSGSVNLSQIKDEIIKECKTADMRTVESKISRIESLVANINQTVKSDKKNFDTKKNFQNGKNKGDSSRSTVKNTENNNEKNEDNVIPGSNDLPNGLKEKDNHEEKLSMEDARAFLNDYL